MSAPWNPDYITIYRDRIRRLAAMKRDKHTLFAHLEVYKHDPVAFFMDWVDTYDPRRSDLRYLPFILFEKQIECVQWLYDSYLQRESGVVEKPRDMGITWICVGFAVWLWRFHPGSKIGFGSNKLDKVDKLWEPDSILEKCRMVIRRLPRLLLPRWFQPTRHMPFQKLSNLENGSTISGEGGDQIGRGGRSTIYFLDEAAHVERPKAADAALQDNSDCIIYVSTPNGEGNPFHQKVTGGEYKVFSFRWWHHPLKTREWYEKQKRKRDPVNFAQEIEVDYSAATENICIPAAWVRAARDLHGMRPIGKGTAGLDIGGEGADKTVYIRRRGPVVDNVQAWDDGDTTATAHKARMLAKADGVTGIVFDKVGIGAGVLSTFREFEDIQTKGVNVGERASDTPWPDGARGHEKFLNLKAELWWTMRDRFRKTFEYVQWLLGEKGGEKHPAEELISIPDCPELERQLSFPKYVFLPNGKIRLETKDEMKKRGVKSPDHADALANTFVRLPEAAEAVKMKGLY